MWIIGIVAFVIGCLAIWIAWEGTDYGEYPFSWWFGWGLCGIGVLIFTAALAQSRSTYLLISSIIGIVCCCAFLLGKSEDEYLPIAWLGLGTIVSNVLVFFVGNVLPTQTLALIASAIAVIGWIAGLAARNAENGHYDTLMMGGSIFCAVAIILFSHTIRTPLEKINEVLIPEFNTTLDQGNGRSSNYQNALNQAKACESQIATESADETATANLAVANELFAKSAAHRAQAQTYQEQAGTTAKALTEWTSASETQILARTQAAQQFSTESEYALTYLMEVCNAYREIASEWRRTILWTEVADYWVSEAYDLPSYKACYYGELFTTVSHDKQVTETLIAEEQARTGSTSIFESDSQGTDWKVFTMDDYVWLVNHGLIPPMANTQPSENDLAFYLCGNPDVSSTGIITEGLTIVKESGVLKIESEDEEDLFVGNYEYGTWCQVDAQGNVQSTIPEDQAAPESAAWCWHQPKGRSTYYYWRIYNGAYVQGPRRCVYCTPQSSWSGSEVVTDAQMARTNGTDKTSVRGPIDVGGGPGTGK